MAVYFDYTIKAPSEEPTTNIAWHPLYPVLAVSSTDTKTGSMTGSVRLYMDEGELVDGMNLTKVASVTAMSWHPNKKLLVIGWSNGTVTLWNEHEKTAREDNNIHKGAVRFADWNPCGNRFVTLDEAGVVAFWKADKRGSFTLHQQTKKTSALTHGCFCPLKEHKMNPDIIPPFVFGGVKGSVYWMDDN
eukprot:Colp12_sorted_trinity150504_noHs@28720